MNKTCVSRDFKRIEKISKSPKHTEVVVIQALKYGQSCPLSQFREHNTLSHGQCYISYTHEKTKGKLKLDDQLSLLITLDTGAEIRM